MTVIVAKKTKDGFIMGSDSIATYYWIQTKGKNTTASKLFKENEVVVGSTGTVEEGTLFRLFLKTRKIQDATENGVLDLLSDFYDWKNKKTNDGKIENHYLLGIKRKLFLVEGWGIQEIKTFYAIGAGMEFAMTALYLGHSCKKAVSVAIELSPQCEGPYQEFRN